MQVDSRGSDIIVISWLSLAWGVAISQARSRMKDNPLTVASKRLAAW